MARAVVDELVRGGVTEVIVCPGSRSAALAMAAHAEPGLRVHVHVDERSAAFVALGLARASGRAAAVITTSGSAVANLLPAAVEADHGAIPLVLLTADRPVELRHTGANQTITQPGLLSAAVRWHVDIGAPEDRADAVALWRATVSRALAEAHGFGGRPGPVQVNLGFREPTVPVADDDRYPAATWTHDIAGRGDGLPWTAAAPAPAVADDAVLDELVQAIDRAGHGLVVVGDTTADPAAVCELGAALGWPVVAEGTAPVRLAATARVLATGTHLFAHDEFRELARPDLVLRIGRTSVSSTIDRALGADVPQVGLVAPGQWHDERRAIARLLVGDPTATCRRLAQRCRPVQVSAWRDWWNGADDAVSAAIAGALDGTAGLSEPYVARRVAAAVPAGGALVVAASMPIRDVDRFAATRDGARLHANRGASGIDGQVSTTLGVALASGDTPTVGLLGDLALLHDANGMLLTTRPSGPVVFVAVDNDGGGIFSFLPQAAFTDSFEAVFGTPHGRDFHALARFHGLAYTRAEDVETFRVALDAAVETPGIHLVHVRSDRSDNVAVHRELAAAITDALDTFVDTHDAPA